MSLFAAIVFGYFHAPLTIRRKRTESGTVAPVETRNYTADFYALVGQEFERTGAFGEDATYLLANN